MFATSTATFDELSSHLRLWRRDLDRVSFSFIKVIRVLIAHSSKKKMKNQNKKTKQTPMGRGQMKTDLDTVDEGE
ncbi:hypothetical protein PGT21_017889 [Puccinia graminis f. sp. tritici]|uniref:Uncharacterized protein n=1 Tax=Puccinia graminis f. sp. tritici TaxID=56615 RepID=A0A5B0PKA4_PUCGR|nr:hypothetical protein PGT21_017889 [Puccinia graminis f. sp. tritici]